MGSTQEPIQAPQIGNVYPGDTSAFSQAESLLTDDNLNNPPQHHQHLQCRSKKVMTCQQTDLYR